MRAVLKNRPLLLLGAAEVVNALGSWITTMALASLLIFQRGGTIGQTTALYLTGLVPMLLLGPFAGWLCDRFDRRPLMIISRLLSGAVVLGLMFADSLLWIYILQTLASAFATVASPARASSMPDIVAADDLTQANAFMQQTTGIVKIVAPTLAAALLTVISPRTAMLLDVISYVLSALILGLLPPLPPHAGARGTQAKAATPRVPLQTAVAGVLKAAPGLMLLMPLNAVICLALGAFDTAIPVYTRDVLQTGIGYQGVIAGGVGLGTLAGSGVFLVLKGQRNLWRDLIGGCLLLAALPAAFAVGDWTGPVMAKVIVAAACLLGGIGLGVVNVQQGTLIQRNCPPEWLGRFSGTFDSSMLAGRLAGLLLTPLLVPSVVSFGWYFSSASVALLAAIGVAAAGAARIAARERHAASLREVRLGEG